MDTISSQSGHIISTNQYQGTKTKNINFSVNFVVPSQVLVDLFWVVFTISLIWVFFMIPLLVYVRKEVDHITLFTFKLLFTKIIQVNLFKSFYSVGFVLLIPFGTFLVLPVVRTLLSMSSCHYFSNINDFPVLSGDSSLKCWTGNTTSSSVLGLIAFLIYYPAVAVAYPRLQQVHSVHC